MEDSRNNKRRFGSIGESIAIGYLQRNRYIFLGKNYRVGRLGEIDIIARDGEFLCFIEVKTRSNSAFGAPSESVTIKKQENIRRIAAIYINQRKLHHENIRFDIVEIIGKKKISGFFEATEINLIKNAF